MELEDLQGHMQGNGVAAARSNGSVTNISKTDFKSDSPTQIKTEENIDVKDEDVDVDVLEDWLKVGQKLEVEWGGEWWDGVPKEIRVNRLVF